jgi:antitoxin FitA
MSKMIQIRDVPDALHSELKRRAAKQALSLSDYLKSELCRIAERPTLDEMLNRLASQPPIEKITVPVEDIVRAHREA